MNGCVVNTAWRKLSKTFSCLQFLYSTSIYLSPFPWFPVSLCLSVSKLRKHSIMWHFPNPFWVSWIPFFSAMSFDSGPKVIYVVGLFIYSSTHSPTFTEYLGGMLSTEDRFVTRHTLPLFSWNPRSIGGDRHAHRRWPQSVISTTRGQMQSTAGAHGRGIYPDSGDD